MDLLGIDELQAVKRENRSWEGIRQFFDSKVPELGKLRDDAAKIDGKTKLLAAVIDETIDSLRRQLSATSFVNAVPVLINEYHSTSVETLSRKNIVATTFEDRIEYKRRKD
ncbi:hypothetical protein SNE40_016295 [Patella caerulea]|uniref:Uncharacterized protein n=1 Tax=Patella caerulea TaxID=87958 RepID=A0AAN8JDW4_PATCE